MSEPHKTCSRCKQSFPLYMFHKDVSKSLGVGCYCKKCHNRTTADNIRRRRVLEGFHDMGGGTKRPNPVTVTIKKPGPLREVERRSKLAEPEVHVVTADEHIPFMDEVKADAVRRYCADTRLAGRHFLGDVVENAAVSRWLDGNVRRQFDVMKWPEQMEQAAAYLSDSTMAARTKNPKCRVTMLQGNHEAWAERYRDRFPMLGDLLDVPLALDLAERGIEWHRFWTHNEAVELGKLILIHGRFASVTHARRHLLKYKRSMLYGHVHDTQRADEPAWGRSGDPLVAQAIGCLRTTSVDWQNHDINNWQHAFAVVWVWPDGDFVHQVIPVKDRKGFIGPTNGVWYRT